MTREISLLDPSGKPVRFDGRMLMNAAATPWQGFALEVRALHGNGENPACYNPHPLLGFCTRGQGKAAMTTGRRTSHIETRPGSVCIFEQGYEVDHVTWSGQVGEMIAVEIRPEALRDLMPEGNGELHLQTHLSTTDATLSSLAIAMRDEVERGCTSGRMHAQGLSMALVSYLQHRFCEAYRAYVGRGQFDYPKRLAGDRDADSVYEKFRLPVPKPALVGDVSRCRQVFMNGGDAGKTAITFINPEALPRIASPVTQRKKTGTDGE